MPIVGWYCVHCKKETELDHFEVSPCGLKLHPDYASAVLHNNDEYYGHELTTVTDGLGCPRSRAIEKDNDVYVNPIDYNPLLIGKAWDTAIGKGTHKVLVAGNIAGIHVAGEIDRVRRSGFDLLIEDWKHSNNNQQRFLKKELAEGTAVKTEYKIQTSLYAELYHQTFGERPTKGMIWNHYSGAQSSYNDVLIPLIYDVLSLDYCLNYQPYGGDYTVLNLLQQSDSYHSGLGAMDLPLVGETMKFGSNTMCAYCQVRDACLTAAKGAPF